MCAALDRRARRHRRRRRGSRLRSDRRCADAAAQRCRRHRLDGVRASGPVDQVLSWISVGSADATEQPVLDARSDRRDEGVPAWRPVRVALGLIEDGEVVAGVLGCPNIPNDDGSTGAIFVAADSTAEVHTTGDRRAATPISVANPARPLRGPALRIGGVGPLRPGSVGADRPSAGDHRRAVPHRQPVQVRRSGPRRRLDLSAVADPGGLRREDLGSRGRASSSSSRRAARSPTSTARHSTSRSGPASANNRGVVATSGGFHAEVIDAVTQILR